MNAFFCWWWRWFGIWWWLLVVLMMFPSWRLIFINLWFACGLYSHSPCFHVLFTEPVKQKQLPIIIIAINRSINPRMMMMDCRWRVINEGVGDSFFYLPCKPWMKTMSANIGIPCCGCDKISNETHSSGAAFTMSYFISRNSFPLHSIAFLRLINFNIGWTLNCMQRKKTKKIVKTCGWTKNMFEYWN